MQEGLSFYGSQKGDEVADTDLMFQFCLPKEKQFNGCQVDVVLDSSACLIPFAGVWRCYLSTGDERDGTGRRIAKPIAF